MMTHHPTAVPATPAFARTWLDVAALPFLVAVFGVLRGLAMANDLWLDELWTLWHVKQLRSVGEIFTRFLHDNNHPLNTLWMYVLAPWQVDWTYRSLSWLSGTAGIWLAAKIARIQFLRLNPSARQGQANAAELITALLFGSSYLLVVYSSEARGYGPALGFGLLAIYALFRGSDDRFSAWTVVYGMASIVALLAHAVSYQLLAAGIVFTAVESSLRRPRLETLHPPREEAAPGAPGGHTRAASVVAALFRWHGVPAAFGVFYYATFMRRLEIVGGPETPVASVLGELGSYAIGFPAANGVGLALPLLLVAIVVALTHMWRRSVPLAAFYGTAMIAFPAAALWASPFIYLFPRYFLLSAALALLLLGYLGGVARNAGQFARPLVLVLLALIVAGNVAHTLKLLRHGRGEYKAALRYIASHSPDGEISLGSDHDGRNILLIHHHGPDTIKPRSLRYYPQHALPAEGPQWLLVHRLEHAEIPSTDVRDARGNIYHQEKVFLHAPLSGWEWYLYRNTRLLPPAPDLSRKP